MSNTTTNEEEIQVVNIATPEHIDEVPAVIRQIVAHWETMANGLLGEVISAAGGPAGALSAATKGGGYGMLTSIVCPSLLGLADAIERRLADLAEVEAALRFTPNDEPHPAIALAAEGLSPDEVAARLYPTAPIAPEIDGDGPITTDSEVPA